MKLEDGALTKAELKVEDGKAKIKHEHMKHEVKDECPGATKVKLEGGVVKAEASVKSEIKSEEVKSEAKREQMKQEAEDELVRSLPVLVGTVKVEPEHTFEIRVPYWKRMCVEFQRKKKTWSPYRPCCPANIFLPERGPPAKLESCYERLGPKERRSFRLCVESPEVNHRLIEYILLTQVPSTAQLPGALSLL